MRTGKRTFAGKVFEFLTYKNTKVEAQDAAENYKAKQKRRGRKVLYRISKGTDIRKFRRGRNRYSIWVRD